MEGPRKLLFPLFPFLPPSFTHWECKEEKNREKCLPSRNLASSRTRQTINKKSDECYRKNETGERNQDHG